MPYDLPPLDKDGKLNVVIETPKQSRNKFKWDEDRGLWLLSKVLPAGMSFPFDFGFIPNTEGEDGDPLDVLLLMDEPAFPGCLVISRLIGAIEAEQAEKGGMVRNDRLIAVADECEMHKEVCTLDDLDPALVAQIEHFFVSYNAAEGKEFRPIQRIGHKRALALVEKGRRRERKAS
jgi:inorganic pyrophosphatase